MSNVPEIESAEALLADRRRPGRRPDISPQLIPLLRGTLEPIPEQEIDPDEPDQLQAARGLVFGTVISAVLWGGIALLARWVAW